MGQSSTVSAESTSVEFGADRFKANASLYAENKRAVDAIATGIAKAKGGYDSFDDAIATITQAWEALRNQVVKGVEYTPPVNMGFGSNNAGQIAGALTGDRTSVGDIRKAFSTLGK